MPSGTRGRGNPDYSSTEYAQPWGGIDVALPSSQIPPGSAVSLSGSIVRGALTNPPSYISPISSVPVILPAFGPGESPLLITNLAGSTVVITQSSVYIDTYLSGSARKPFNKVYTFPAPYTSGRFGSVVIGNKLYFSSAALRGVYSLTQFGVVQEISAQNGSGPFIGGDFLFTIAQRLCLANIIGGDGNQTGTVTGATVTTGGTGYPASGSVTFVGGGGQSATGTFTAAAGVITSITVTNGGFGFLSAPTPTIVGTTGTGFTGTATISGVTTNSTNTAYPDRVAASFASAYGSFDPNSLLLGGFFTQITEARGLITGVAVFEAVAFIAHNGGFTEMVPNTSSAVGSNIEPFTFAPLWSADQGVVCRYGSLAQYGAMCCFLGYDQPYQLSPNGLNPFGDQIASLVQNLSFWNYIQQINGGLFGSIVEIEGEKHYFITLTSTDPTFSTPTNRFTFFYDCNLKSNVWTTNFYPGMTVSAALYQSYDTQIVSTNIVRDNWILLGIQDQNFVGSGGYLGQLLVGQTLFLNTQTPLFSGFLDILFRAETPTTAIPQTTRRLVVEYENIPSRIAAVPTLSCTLFGQPKPNSTGAATPIANPFAVNLPYYALSASIPQNAVLTATGEPGGTANTTLATSIEIFTNNPVRIIRVSFQAETTQSDLQ